MTSGKKAVRLGSLTIRPRHRHRLLENNLSGPVLPAQGHAEFFTWNNGGGDQTGRNP